MGVVEGTSNANQAFAARNTGSVEARILTVERDAKLLSDSAQAALHLGTRRLLWVPLVQHHLALLRQPDLDASGRHEEAMPMGRGGDIVQRY